MPQETVMTGLTVRWSLVGARAAVLAELVAAVEDHTHARFTGMAGLCFTTWRARPGEWFEGSYVFASVEARRAFEDAFVAGAADAPGSRIVGALPQVEPFAVVAVAEGWEGFTAKARIDPL